MKRNSIHATLFLALAIVALPLAATATGTFWIDLYDGEEVAENEVMADLAGAGVIYAGEMHTIDRHHEVQLALLRELHARGVRLALCMEQIEAAQQPGVDRFNSGELDFDGLATAIDWAKSWKNFADYRALCEFARDNGIPVHGINAPAAVIRTVSRVGGIAKLSEEHRATLPESIHTDEPDYERLMGLELSVHMAMDPARLRPVFEAQVSRDETMAMHIVAARHSDPSAPRTAFVTVGAGHVRFGMGTAMRVRLRDPGIVERIVLATESGQLKLSEAMRAMMRDVKITHADLRAIGRPPGDYLSVLPLATAQSDAGTDR